MVYQRTLSVDLFGVEEKNFSKRKGNSLQTMPMVLKVHLVFESISCLCQRSKRNEGPKQGPLTNLWHFSSFVQISARPLGLLFSQSCLYIAGEKPFKCTEAGCSKQFAEQSSLKKHLLVHTSKCKIHRLYFHMAQ